MDITGEMWFGVGWEKYHNIIAKDYSNFLIL